MATPLGNGPPRQDMPPKGGFPMPEFLRRMPKRFPGAVIWGTVLGSVGYGVFKMWRSRPHIQRLHEGRAMRAVMTAYLQAESDVVWRRQNSEAEQRERALMVDVPGWRVGDNVYHNKDIWVPPPRSYA